jgi:hypothetical protein
LLAYIKCTQQHTRRSGVAFNRAAWKLDRKMCRKQNETNSERETETLKISAATKNRRAHLQVTKTHDRWQRITSLLQSRIYIWKIRRRAVKETGTNESQGKGRPPPFVLTSEANLRVCSLQRELQSVVSGEFFFRNTATRNRITAKSVVDYTAIKNSSLTKCSTFLHFTQKTDNPVNAFCRGHHCGPPGDRLRRHKCKTHDGLASNSRSRGHTHHPPPLPGYASKKSKSSRNVQIDNTL